jgi:hypothetical protein
MVHGHDFTPDFLLLQEGFAEAVELFRLDFRVKPWFESCQVELNGSYGAMQRLTKFLWISDTAQNISEQLTTPKAFVARSASFSSRHSQCPFEDTDGVKAYS